MEICLEGRLAEGTRKEQTHNPAESLRGFLEETMPQIPSRDTAVGHRFILL